MGLIRKGILCAEKVNQSHTESSGRQEASAKPGPGLPGGRVISTWPKRLAGEGRKGFDNFQGIEADHVGETQDFDHVHPPLAGFVFGDEGLGHAETTGNMGLSQSRVFAFFN